MDLTLANCSTLASARVISLADPHATASVWTHAILAGSINEGEPLLNLVGVDFYGDSVPVSNYPYTPRMGPALTTFQNQVFIHGGLDWITKEGISLEVLTFVCTGSSSRGNDSWVSNATYNGCDLVNCATGHWGSECAL